MRFHGFDEKAIRKRLSDSEENENSSQTALKDLSDLNIDKPSHSFIGRGNSFSSDNREIKFKTIKAWH